MIRKIVSVAALAIATAPMIALTANMASANANPTRVTVFNQGGYVADYQVSYSLNGQTRSLTFRQLRLGQKRSTVLPNGSQNIRVRGQVYTGLLWEPKRMVFDQFFRTASSEICFKTYGTTLAAQWSNECAADF